MALLVGVMVVLSCQPQQQNPLPTQDQPPRKPQNLATAPARPLNAIWPAPHQWDVAGFDELKLAVGSRPSAPRQRLHRVQSGETLTVIAKKYYNDANQWRRIYDANKALLSTPDSVKVGMNLFIPEQ